jgi:predicted metal-dependent peptidase
MIHTALLGAAVSRPYYGRALSALTVVETDAVPTIGVTSRWHLLVNPTWFGERTTEERIALIAQHEVEHLLRQHALRFEGREGHHANAAADLEINDDATGLPPGGWHPATCGFPEGLLAEEYYDLLPSSPEDPCEGSGAGGLPLPIEAHLSGGLDRDASDTLIDQVALDVLATEGKAAGSVPRGIVVWAQQRRAPRPVPLPLRVSRALARAVGGGERGDYTWRRLRRRESPVLRPGVQTTAHRVALVVDTSGSMAEDGCRALAAVAGAARAYEIGLIVVCDADVHTISRTIPREWRGGGGTDLRPAIERALTDDPDLVVVVTDGETPWPDAAPTTPVIAVVVGACAVPSWLQVVRV